MMRAAKSGPPPAGKGTTKVTVREGKAACAWAAAGKQAAAAKAVRAIKKRERGNKRVIMCLQVGGDVVKKAKEGEF
jgi:hypothetical protein